MRRGSGGKRRDKRKAVTRPAARHVGDYPTGESGGWREKKRERKKKGRREGDQERRSRD